MTKPTLRIIHHMARTGGTLICKCLGCMEQVLLLSEIHPVGIKLVGNNLILQAVEWFELLNKQEAKDILSTSQSFNSTINVINNKVEKQGKKLVIRDWSHLDFTAVPFLPEPSYRLMLYETLAEDFDILRFATTRHPIPQWLSLERCLALSKCKISVEQYLEGYLKFAEAAKEMDFFRYEDFTQHPDETLRKMTGILQLDYDGKYKNKWRFYLNVSGETKNNWLQIMPESRRKRPTLESSLVREFTENKNYWAALEILGYEHYEV